MGARARRDAVMRASGDEDETISNLDKLLGDFGAVPAREEPAPAPPRALDAEAKADGARVAADLAKAQARIAREKAEMMGRGRGQNKKAPEEEYDYSERAIAALVYMLPAVG